MVRSFTEAVENCREVDNEYKKVKENLKIIYCMIIKQELGKLIQKKT